MRMRAVKFTYYYNYSSIPWIEAHRQLNRTPKKRPDRGRAKRVSALRVRVDRAKSDPHADQNVVSRKKSVRIGGARSAFQQYEYAYIARKVVRIRTKMSCRPKKISGSGAREARFSTTSTRRSCEQRSAYGPKCRVQRKKYPDRERAKRVSALRVRVDRAKSVPHPD